ncbi:Coq4-domain-containing protein [Auriscalpium vulgare]|uniref:Coq4-domain-containing protein n=1 Tax=Auriscalpium vulgare TaxID=40419 RepID=A0ACB8S8Q2_9AGAM|nr:Coq4-domain-containing protein [Auriscalpium vulgare]
MSLPTISRRALSTHFRIYAASTGAAFRHQTRSLKTTPAYPGHVPLNWFENAFLAAGSAFMALADPRRGDMVAALGETTAGPALPRLRERMLESAEGRRILRDRPRVNSSTVDMDKLAQLPEGSFGHTYVTWLERCGVTPDTREPVHYIDDPELAYVMQRYRECHDFYHALCGLPVSVEYELALKVLEFANLGLPSALLSTAAAVRLTPAKRARLLSEYVPWALRCGARSLITVYWEQRWEQDTKELRRELGILDPPEPKWRRPLGEAKAAAAKRAQAQEMAQAQAVSQ